MKELKHTKKVMTPFGVMENHAYTPKKDLKARGLLRSNSIAENRSQWYLELILAALVGVSITLAFVVIHGMLTTEWTW